MTDLYFKVNETSNTGVIITEQMYASWCGLRITPNEGETVGECLERCTVFNPPAVYPIINMVIACPSCEQIKEYKTLDDIPDYDVPCDCRPLYYFIKIGKTE